ncbi:hypothetical protein BkAM31D_14875 [Halalkalibacter krulwichiae]|uniref:Uncharacterized protein n=1 Tax=Halalkalibacter krulwichiae TaxID=199441 RepID=A0A1X9MK74_9BACI|nr:hypothetical protein BkAM31D_14875 [Halalkalibacter krulwichiae]
MKAIAIKLSLCLLNALYLYIIEKEMAYIF